jgi:signal-transduction protein with cAMP-binding, CBS, and nucleotidyltransferase domain
MQTTVAHPMQMITHQGEPADGVRVIAHGRIVMFMRASPWPRVLRFGELGECFGDETVLTHLGPTWRFSAIAHNHSEIFLLPTADLKSVMKRFPSLRCAAKAAAERAAERVMLRVAERVLAPFIRRFLARRGIRKWTQPATSADQRRRVTDAAEKVRKKRRVAASMKLGLSNDGPQTPSRLTRSATMVADARPIGFEPGK